MELDNQSTMVWASGLNLLAGLWLIFSPLWIHYAHTGNVTQQVVLGVVVALLAIARMAMPRATWPSWINFLIGVYLIAMPWFINATSAARWNQVILGIIVAVLSLLSATTSDTLEVTNGTQPAAGFYERLDDRDRNR